MTYFWSNFIDTPVYAMSAVISNLFIHCISYSILYMNNFGPIKILDNGADLFLYI